MDLMFVTELVSQSPTSWLKLVAPENMFFRLSTPLTSQSFRGWLKLVAPWNTACMFVTDAVLKVLTTPLKPV